MATTVHHVPLRGVVMSARRGISLIPTKRIVTVSLFSFLLQQKDYVSRTLMYAIVGCLDDSGLL